MEEAVLRLEDVNSRISGDFSLADINLSLLPGQVFSLTGRNRSGKSALLRVIMGQLPISSGSFYLNGRPVRLSLPSDALKMGLICVSSDQALFDNLSIAENIYFGTKMFGGGAFGAIPTKKVREKAQELFQGMGVEIDPDRRLNELTYSQIQLVRIARAIASDARIILLDEPTARLSAAERGMAVEAVNNLKRSGRSFIIASQDLDFILQVSDQLGIMDKGELTLRRDLAGLTKRQLMEEVYNMTMESLYGSETAALGGELLRLTGVCAGGLEPLTLDLEKGEIMAVVGNHDSGAVALARGLGGFDPTDGEILLEGAALYPLQPWAAVERGIVVSIGPDEQRIQEYFDEYLTSNPPRGAMDRRAMLLKYRLAEMSRGISMVFSAFMQRAADQESSPDIVNRALHRKGKLYLLVDPSEGMDLSARSRLYGKIRNLAAQGAGILLLTSDLEEAAALANRVLVLKAGKVAGLLKKEEATEQRLSQLL